MDEPEESVKEGRWTAEEKRIFEEAYEQYGHNWKKIASIIKSRNSTQVRSHAQKYLVKKKKEARLKELMAGNKRKPESELYHGWVFHSVKAAQCYQLLCSTLGQINDGGSSSTQEEEKKEESPETSDTKLA